MATNRTDCEGFHRRDFLKLGTAGLLGLTLPDLLRLEAQSAAAGKAKAKSVIMVWLAGGPATIDMWDLKPDAPETIRGEFKPIDTKAAGIQIGEHLPKMAQVIDKCTIVRSLYHNIGAHELGTVYMTTGNRPSVAMKFPSLGSIMSKTLPTPVGIPPYVTFGQLRNGNAGGAGYLGTAYNPFEPRRPARQGHLAPQRLLAPGAGGPQQAGGKVRESVQTCGRGGRHHRRARQVPAAGAGHPPLRQDQEGLRPGQGAAAAA
jgi:hypothetical protein